MLAITAPSLDIRSGEADELLEGLKMLGNAEIAPVQGAEQAAQLATVIARTGLDPWHAHVAATADAAAHPQPDLRRGSLQDQAPKEQS